MTLTVDGNDVAQSGSLGVSGGSASMSLNYKGEITEDSQVSVKVHTVANNNFILGQNM